MVRNTTRKLFHGVNDFFSEMNQMSAVMHGRAPEHQPRTEETAWAPLTDIKAEGDDLVIRCDLPGVPLEEIDISFANGVLIISGERETADENYYVHERFYGAFRRTIGLPEGIGDDDIHATYRQGLLIVTVDGGATASAPKKIQISGDSD